MEQQKTVKSTKKQLFQPNSHFYCIKTIVKFELDSRFMYAVMYDK